MPELRQSLLRDFFSLLPAEWLKSWNKVELTAKLHNGTEIFFRPLEDASSVRGLTVGAIAVDEATEVPWDTWQVLRGRLRLAGIADHKLFAATNPEGPDHYLFAEFVDPGRRSPEHAYFEASSLENIFTPEAYRRDLAASYAGVDRDRYLLGRWIQSESLVWPNWDPRVSWIAPFAIPVEWPRERAIDFGFIHPFVCLVGAWDEESKPSRLVVYDEYVMPRASLEEHAEAIANIAAREPPGFRGYRATWADHDEQDRYQLARMPQTMRVLTAPARKDRRAGVQAVNSALMRGRTGWPRIFVFDNCVKLRAGIERYRRPNPMPKTDPDAVIKVNTRGESVDDEADALRYLFYSRVSSTFQSEPNFQPGMDSLARRRLYGVA